MSSKCHPDVVQLPSRCRPTDVRMLSKLHPNGIQMMSKRLRDVAETMSTMLTRAIENAGINTLKDAAGKIGKGDISKAEEVVKKAGLQNPGMSNDLEPELLKEWMEGAADLLLAVNANKAVAAFAAYSASEAAREALVDFLDAASPTHSGTSTRRPTGARAASEACAR